MTKRVFTKAFATLRLSGKTLDPLDVTKLLGLPPDRQRRAGEPRLSRTKNGRVVQRGEHTSGQWRMSSKGWVDSPRLHVHVNWMLSELEPVAEPLREILGTGARGDIFCYSAGRTSEHPAIPNETRLRAEALGLAIEIDHYETNNDENST